MNLVGQLPSELEDLAVELGASRYRGRQLATWIYRKSVFDLEAMTDLPKDFRARLGEVAFVEVPVPERLTPSQDGSQKLVFALDGGARISSVLMPDDDRITLCVSTQVGCGFACAFCLTGVMGLERNLTASEILGQVLAANRLLGEGRRATHIVFMGMGEPLANYAALVKALRILTDAKLGLGYSPRRITVSTVGLVPGIEKLGREDLKVNLIPFNDWEGASFRRPPLARILAFQGVLLDAGITTTVRWSKGEDVGAACGQLWESREATVGG